MYVATSIQNNEELSNTLVDGILATTDAWEANTFHSAVGTPSFRGLAGTNLSKTVDGLEDVHGIVYGVFDGMDVIEGIVLVRI